MNTKIYQAVHALAQRLMAAAEKDDQAAFTVLFAELKALCEAHEGSAKDHPVQWETLADFTEDLADAVPAYTKALSKAQAINAQDYIASIAFSMASLQLELEQRAAAINNLNLAQQHANNIEDQQLKDEIQQCLQALA